MKRVCVIQMGCPHHGLRVEPASISLEKSLHDLGGLPSSSKAPSCSKVLSRDLRRSEGFKLLDGGSRSSIESASISLEKNRVTLMTHPSPFSRRYSSPIEESSWFLLSFQVKAMTIPRVELIPASRDSYWFKYIRHTSRKQRGSREGVTDLRAPDATDRP